MQQSEVEISDAELINSIGKAWRSCLWMRGCKDGSHEWALSDAGFYDLCREAERRGIDWNEIIG